MKGLIFIGIFIFSSCSVVQKQLAGEEVPKPEVKFKQNVEVTIGDQKIAVEAGKPIEFSGDQPILAEAKGRVPLFIYPVASKNKSLSIDLPQMDESKISDIQLGQINKELDALLPEIQAVQIMLLKRDYINALSKIRDLRVKHPKIAFLSFIEGSTYMILNRNGEALKALQEGLQIYPDSSEAQELYKKLTNRGL